MLSWGHMYPLAKNAELKKSLISHIQKKNKIDINFQIISVKKK